MMRDPNYKPGNVCFAVWNGEGYSKPVPLDGPVEIELSTPEEHDPWLPRPITANLTRVDDHHGILDAIGIDWNPVGPTKSDLMFEVDVVVHKHKVWMYRHDRKGRRRWVKTGNFGPIVGAVTKLRKVYHNIELRRGHGR